MSGIRRRTTGEILRKERVISKMIDRIKALFQDVAPLEMGPDEPEEAWPDGPENAAAEPDGADVHDANTGEGYTQ